jgi:hypothetical protein
MAERQSMYTVADKNFFAIPYELDIGGGCAFRSLIFTVLMLQS